MEKFDTLNEDITFLRLASSTIPTIQALLEDKSNIQPGYSTRLWVADALEKRSLGWISTGDLSETYLDLNVNIIPNIGIFKKKSGSEKPLKSNFEVAIYFRHEDSYVSAEPLYTKTLHLSTLLQKHNATGEDLRPKTESNQISIVIYNLRSVSLLRNYLWSLALQEDVEIKRVQLLSSNTVAKSHAIKSVTSCKFQGLGTDDIEIIANESLDEIKIDDSAPYVLFADSNCIFQTPQTLRCLIHIINLGRSISSAGCSVISSSIKKRASFVHEHVMTGFQIEKFDITRYYGCYLSLITNNLLQKSPIPIMRVIANNPRISLWKSSSLSQHLNTLTSAGAIDSWLLESSIKEACLGNAHLVTPMLSCVETHREPPDRHYILRQELVPILLASAGLAKGDWAQQIRL